jgi:sugar phosphate permease
MNWKNLFRLRGLNGWLVAVCFGWSAIWAVASLAVTSLVLRADAGAAAVTQIGLMLSAFVGPLLCGWVTGRVAADGRGPTYGLISGLVSAALFGLALAPIGGILGILMAAVSLAGGLNGGLLSLSRPPRQ